MATALGTTLPAGGESGTVAGVNHMVDQIPDNPATLAASTSIETISNIMYDNWVWRNTFQVDASMLPGHVFGVIKIHPKNCHPYLTHLAEMFLTWTGSMKIRMRPMATFQFGGSFRVGFFPPRFTATEIQNMPIQTLTAYPNVDLDPKNTGWVNFEASDERNVLFHWMRDLADDSVSSFGGYFVFYVAAPLVVSGGTPSTVTFLVEAAGGFNFAQLARIGDLVPSANAWIPAGPSENIMAQIGCDDYTAVQAMQINENTITALTNGFFLSGGLGGEPSTAFNETSVLGPVPTSFRAAVQGGKIPCSSYNADIDGSATTYWLKCKSATVVPPQNGNKHTSFGAKTGVTTVATTDTRSYLNDTGAAPYLTSYRYTNYTGSTEGDVIGCMNTETLFTPIPLIDAQIAGDDSILTNPLPDESIITFNSQATVSFNLQTRSMTTAMAAIDRFDRNTSQLYQLFQGSSPTPVLTIRLHPSGMMTTRGVDAPALLHAQKLYLRYLQDLPMTTPLPPALMEHKFLRAAARCSTKGYTTEKQWQTNLWKHF